MEPVTTTTVEPVTDDPDNGGGGSGDDIFEIEDTPVKSPDKAWDPFLFWGVVGFMVGGPFAWIFMSSFVS